jgi:hypothetical protein
MGGKRSTGSIVAIVGGAALAIGAFLTWATASIDVPALASLLGVDESTLSGAFDQTSKSISGLDADADGKWALAMGIIVVVLALIYLLRARARVAVGVLIILAGLAGGGIALYDITTVDDAKQDAIAQVEPELQAAGIDTSTLGDIFDISLGVGIWVCALGGLVAILGGAMVLAVGDEAPAAGAAAMETGSGMAMGPPMAGASAGMAPPAVPAPTPMPPAIPAAPPSEPSSPRPTDTGEASPSSDDGSEATP